MSTELTPRPDAARPDPEDRHAWLENIDGDEALAWVRARNAEAAVWAQGPAFVQLVRRVREVLDAKDKIPFVKKRGSLFYNLWRDVTHARGLWRRITWASYRSAQPAWETVLDLDALGREEKESWVFAGATYLEPACHQTMLALSPGGSDACVQREFDTCAKAFVKDGFVLPQAKSRLSWLNPDTLLVGSDFGPGSLTTSGYPRTVRRWVRGTPLADAPVIFAGEASDVAVGAAHDSTPGFERTFVSRSPTFFTSETFWLQDSGAQRKIDIPDDANHWVHRQWILVKLRRAWSPHGDTGPRFDSGALIVAPFARFMAGTHRFIPLFTPTASSSLEGLACTRDFIILQVLEHVRPHLEVMQAAPSADSDDPGAGSWRHSRLAGCPDFGSLSVAAVDDTDIDNAYFLTAEDSLNPAALYFGSLGGPSAPDEAPGAPLLAPTGEARPGRTGPDKIKQMPAFFDASQHALTQHFTASKDGTRVPYFQIARRDLTPTGNARTLLYGYGGFEVSLLPHYSGSLGRAWLEDGGVYVVANIRGGGEYGPRWHEAALKGQRHRAYEDFAAVAEDLVRRQVTKKSRLGIMGGSNGGLLVGNMLVHYPALFGAVVCQVPLLDMKRFPHLLAGASWIGEYGDPDKPEEWASIQTFSPYHHVRSGVAYPPSLFLTSTRDDRVHPGHARKMMEKMRLQGCNVHYYENIEGGHGGAADNAQAAHMMGLAHTFLKKYLV